MHTPTPPAEPAREPAGAVPPIDPANTLQDRLESGGTGPAAAAPPSRAVEAAIDDPVGLLERLEATGRFHRDSGVGRMFHPGSVSLRENRPTDSLHVVVDGNRLAAHVDRVSPLGLRPGQRSRYSARRAVAHNLSGAAHDLLLLVQGRQGDHRSELDCHWEAGGEPTEVGSSLLDPASSAWSVQIEARVAGRIDGARLHRALAAALGVPSVPDGVLDEVEADGEVGLASARADLYATALPSWPPLRALLVHHPAGDLVMMSLNHAAGDAGAALGVMGAVAGAYAGGPPARPVDFLALRSLPVRPAADPDPGFKARYRVQVERLRDRLARPARLAADRGGSGYGAGYGFHHHRLSGDETAAVVDRDRPGTSRNVVLAALHLAIGEWNLDHGAPGRRVGVLVPVSLRPQDFDPAITANFSVTARVSTDRRQRAGPQAALRAVTSQTIRNKRTRTGIALLEALDRSDLLPLWAKQSRVVLQPLTRNRWLDTALLVNLGPVEDPPDFGPDTGPTTEVWVSSPARTPEALCVGAVTVGGRMNLVLRYPRRIFGPGSAERFGLLLVRHMMEVAASRDTRPPPR